MKTTGIVRRVDDLGRIVIPREYRRAYDINIGDPIEIIADTDGNILLKRVDFTGEFKRVSEGVAAFLSDQLGCTVAACDKESFLVCFGKKHNAFIGAPVGDELGSAIQRARTTTLDRVAIAHVEGLDEQFSSINVSPIISERGVIGGLVCITERPLSEAEWKIITLSARLIANNMQKY